MAPYTGHEVERVEENPWVKSQVIERDTLRERDTEARAGIGPSVCSLYSLASSKRKGMDRYRSFESNRSLLGTPASTVPGHDIRLRKLAEIQKDLSWASERWFFDKYKETNNHMTSDRFNEPFGPWIPDVINHHYKYVIEIDGSIHRRKDVKKRDQRKNRWFADRGYSVIRISAFDNKSFKNGMKRLNKIHDECLLFGLPWFRSLKK